MKGVAVTQGWQVNRDAVRDAFRKEGKWLQFSSPLMSYLLHGAAEDVALLDLGTHSRPGQPVGLLFPAVAHFLVLKYPDAEVARYFASVSAQPLAPQGAFPAFREFCLEHSREFAELLAWRTMNTNLVERSSCILPALAMIHELTQQPLNLIEICCSSGLNLLFDQYHYDYGPVGQLGNAGASVRLRCKLIGAKPEIAIPQVAARVGIDLVTIDASDPVERLWMEAALCPEWLTERGLLRAALALRAADKGRMLRGDALTVLPTVLSEWSGPLCVLQTYSKGHWSAEAWKQLDATLRHASRHRDIHKITMDLVENEAPQWVRSRMSHLAAAGISLLQKSFPSRMEHSWYSNETVKTRVLAQADGFGAWLDWQTP